MEFMRKFYEDSSITDLEINYKLFITKAVAPFSETMLKKITQLELLDSQNERLASHDLHLLNLLPPSEQSAIKNSSLPSMGSTPLQNHTIYSVSKKLTEGWVDKPEIIQHFNSLLA